jgi:aminocarboxymuconate-semialdehyde decarboxylase
VAQIALNAPDAGVGEAKRAIANGALGVQIYTNIAGKPLDDPEFEPFFAAMEKLNKPIWLHPARNAAIADYASEQKSKYEIWWTFGWSYETAAAMARLVFSKIMDKYPKLMIITHHFGGIVPMVEGRIGPGWDQLGARTSDEDLTLVYKSLKKRPLDYFKHVFYADTASRLCMRALPSTTSTRSCSPPIARSIRKRARCTRARLCVSSRKRTCRRPTRKWSGTATSSACAA